MDKEALQKILEEVAADCVRQLALRVDAVEPGAVRLSLPVAPAMVHAGGVVCGQALMAAADTAMLMAMVAELGAFRPMTTVQLQTSFLRPVPKEASHVSLVARVLRRGRNLSYGEIELLTPDGKLAAHATTTYALI